MASSQGISYQCLVWLRKSLTTSLTSGRLLSTRHIKPRKDTAEGHTKERFVDFLKVRAIGGHGGNGCVSFLAEAGNQFAGPDGGSGGHGGHVVLTSTKQRNSLNHISRILRAECGVNGRNHKRDGRNAPHLYVEVPLGTVIKDWEGKKLSSLTGEREYYIVARGGAGGRGNHYFVSSEDTTPRYAEQGAPGEDCQLALELRVMANIGLIGFPNAGKSTLLRAISRARPKVAEYPFTTLHPHVGMVEYDDRVQVSVADIPGLIPGAHKNHGLGISFLRHIERCTSLLYVLDMSVDQPWSQLNHLKYELDQYQPGLSERPHAVVGNKMDLEEGRQNFILLQQHTDLPVIPVSAERRLNISQLLEHLRELYDLHSDDIMETSSL